jgi:hypothetical protein
MAVDTVAAALSALVALACTAVLARRLSSRSRGRAPLIAWTIGFALFTVAGTCLWYGAATGWTEDVYRLYYLTGGILVVPFLAVGELLLVLPGQRVSRLAAATMLWLTFASAAAVIAADADDVLGGPWTTILAIVMNSAGTVILLAGSLLSARRRRDSRPLLVAAGVAVIALASSATRFDVYAVFVLGQAAGIVLILAGLVAPGRARTGTPAEPAAGGG